jgi:hypothetical protein
VGPNLHGRLTDVGWRLPWCSRLFWSILGDEVDDAQECFGCRCLMGPAFLGGQSFLSGGADVGGAFLLMCHPPSISSS